MQRLTVGLVSFVFVIGCAVCFADDKAPAPCEPHWSAAVGQPGTDGWIYTMYVWDGGNGPQLYAGGLFSTAGGRVANCIATWDGYNWRPLGEGLNGQVMAIMNFDDGTGDALYVGGLFSASGDDALANVARWDAESKRWTPLGEGVNNAVIALAAYDDGNGPALYVGGTFTAAADVPNTTYVAKWDGKKWSGVGGGLDDAVRAFAVFDKGEGTELYVGGNFSRAGELVSHRLARWDGKQWHAIPGRFEGQGIRGMTVHDDGRGPAVFVGGNFQTINGETCGSVARWDPAAEQWSCMGSGTNERVVAMLPFDDGNGEMLYMVGWFTQVSGKSVDRIARWDGKEWSRVKGDDVHRMVARALARYPDGSTSRHALYVGGGFDGVDRQRASRVAAWVGCREAQQLTPSEEPLGREPTKDDPTIMPGRERGLRQAPTRGQPPAPPKRGREAPRRGDG